MTAPIGLENTAACPATAQQLLDEWAREQPDKPRRPRDETTAVSVSAAVVSFVLAGVLCWAWTGDWHALPLVFAGCTVLASTTALTRNTSPTMPTTRRVERVRASQPLRPSDPHR